MDRPRATSRSSSFGHRRPAGRLEFAQFLLGDGERDIRLEVLVSLSGFRRRQRRAAVCVLGTADGRSRPLRRSPSRTSFSAVEGQDGGAFCDLPVQQRLGVAGFVPFVVPVPAVAEDIDDHVLLELLAIGIGERRDADGRVGVIAVDVENRRLHGAREIGRVGRRAGFFGCGGEPDLVVDDDVDRSAGPVPVQLREVDGFPDDTLTGERGVAVHEDRDHLLSGGSRRAVPAWPGSPLRRRDSPTRGGWGWGRRRPGCRFLPPNGTCRPSPGGT